MIKLRNKMVICSTLLILSLTVSGKTVLSSPEAEAPYFPTNGWRRSTPGEQGMDQDRIDEMHQQIINSYNGIESVTIVKNGYLVYEEYFEYYNYSNIHQMFSITKSVISLLVGIANATGFIPNLDQPVLEIFSDRNFTNVDANKQALTIRHLLKMQSGIQSNQESGPYYLDYVDINNYDLFTDTNVSTWPSSWPYNMSNDAFQLPFSNDSIKLILDRPMAHPPGTYFLYSGLDSHLLSAIIQNKTGMTSEEFAVQYLFDPLNITDYLWWKHQIGISMGQTGLWLRPLDMVKIGYLCLNNGLWNTTRIVPEEWIQESFQDYRPGEKNWGYGYQWWINHNRNYFRAGGLGGQTIGVKPDSNLVIVITCSDYNSNPAPLFTAWMVFTSYILESLETTPTQTGITEETTPDSKASLTTMTSEAGSFPGFLTVLLCLGTIVIFAQRYKKA